LKVQGGRGAPLYLFIYSVVQNDVELLDFGLINTCHSPGLAKHLQKCFLPAQRVMGLEMLFS
jgi:hypothetical protein